MTHGHLCKKRAWMFGVRYADILLLPTVSKCVQITEVTCGVVTWAKTIVPSSLYLHPLSHPDKNQPLAARLHDYVLVHKSCCCSIFRYQLHLHTRFCLFVCLRVINFCKLAISKTNLWIFTNL